MGWKPGTGFRGFGQWIGYNEAMILYILALGSPTHPGPDTTPGSAWTSGYNWRHLLRPDLRHLPAALRPPVLALLDRLPGHPGRLHAVPRASPTSRTRAARRSRSGPTASPTRRHCAGYSANLWGLTACDDPARATRPTARRRRRTTTARSRRRRRPARSPSRPRVVIPTLQQPVQHLPAAALGPVRLPGRLQPDARTGGTPTTSASTRARSSS